MAATVGAEMGQHKALLIKLLSGLQKPDNEVASFTDDQRDKVLAMIEAKASGVVVPQETVQVKDATVNLLEALEASLGKEV